VCKVENLSFICLGKKSYCKNSLHKLIKLVHSTIQTLTWSNWGIMQICKVHEIVW